jgi:chemotaxis response regulator CheB
VQSPEEAAADAMPRAALARAGADRVLTLEEMALELPKML